MASDDPIDAPGPRWRGALSLQPLLQGIEFVRTPHKYTTERAKAAGCPIFKAHPGVRTILVSDYAGLEGVFRTAPSVLDRDGTIGFGCVSLFNEHVLEGQVPALVTDRHSHRPARDLIDRAMEHRGEQAFLDACQPLLDGGWPSLAGKDTTPFAEAVVEAAAAITYRWFFDLDGPPGDQHLSWLRESFGLNADTALSGLLAKLAKRPPGSVTRDYSEAWIAAIRASGPHADYARIATEVGLPEAAAAPMLMFAAGFNAAGGTYTTAFPALGVVHGREDIRIRLAEELDGFSGDAAALDDLPYLDALLYESQRWFGRPKQYYRVAVEDTVLPTSDGRRVKIPAGTRVGVVATTARKDPTVFDAPDEFAPERFLEEPQLREQIFAFGPPSDGPSPYGCAGGANGTAPRLWKVIVASLARDTDWRLDPPPTPNVDAVTGLDPDALTWHRR